jgi:peptide methionine sulfoxide reductase MsrB
MQYGKSQAVIDQLTAEQRRITQEAGTERPFTVLPLPSGRLRMLVHGAS